MNKFVSVLAFGTLFNNIEKVQKLSDNKTVILHWITKDKENKSFTCLGNYKLHFQRKFKNAASDSTK